MFGAVIAIGAAMSVFFDETKKAKGALDDIGDSAREAAKETQNLSNATRAYLAVELAKEIREQEAALKALSSQEDDRESKLRRHTSAQEAINFQMQNSMAMAYGGAEAIAGLSLMHVKSADDLRDLNEANDQQAGSVEQVNQKLSELRKQRQALLNQENPFYEMSDSTKRSADSISRDLDRIRESLMTQDEQAYKKYIDDLQTVAQATHLSMEERERLSLEIVNKYRREQEAQRMAAADKENQQAAKQRLAKVKALSDENAELLRQAISDQKEKDRALESLRKDAESVDVGAMGDIERIRYEEQEKLSILEQAEKAGVELSRSYAEIRKGIAQDTAEAILEARLKEASLPELEKVQLEGAKARAEFEKKTARDKTKFVLDELNTELGGLSKYNKKIFALQKGVQIGQAIMNTHTAATRALAQYGMPLGPIFAGLAIANGMAQVAQIKAQSFEGGGFTGTGSRSGGLDGKGGYMAMVHPNETIIDHTKGQAGGVTIINNVDATGGGADVDQKIRVAMEVTSQQTVMQVQDLLRRQRLV
jgi:DNA repair exonuclease SbcCD ATPase subunit